MSWSGLDFAGKLSLPVSRIFRVSVPIIAVFATFASFAQLAGTGVHVPPTTGTYAYNSFSPGAPGFPAQGDTYVDPVFGTTIRRMTDTVGETFWSDIYAFHRSNADGTFIFAGFQSGLDILRTSDGSTAYNHQPTGLATFELYWDANDPNIYYYLSGSSLMRRDLSAQTDSVMKDFGTTLETNGGSLNVQSGDGRYFTVRYNGTNKLWDSQLDIVYSGSVTQDGHGGGWVSITPNASHFVTGSSQQTSYEIDHNNKSISPNGVMFWNLCGDHGALVSATDGKSYMVTAECHTLAAVYRVDVTLNQQGRTPQQQRDDNMMLAKTEWADAMHMSAVSKGPNRDWVFVDTEDSAGNDNFNAPPTGWTAYRSEIFAVNVVTGDVRRLAHHRSRNINTSYYYQPRVSSSWDGSVVMWASNMNLNGSDYNDFYLIKNPLDGLGTPVTSRPSPIVDLVGVDQP